MTHPRSPRYPANVFRADTCGEWHRVVTATRVRIAMQSLGIDIDGDPMYLRGDRWYLSIPNHIVQQHARSDGAVILENECWRLITHIGLVASVPASEFCQYVTGSADPNCRTELGHRAGSPRGDGRIQVLCNSVARWQVGSMLACDRDVVALAVQQGGDVRLVQLIGRRGDGVEEP